MKDERCIIVNRRPKRVCMCRYLVCIHITYYIRLMFILHVGMIHFHFLRYIGRRIGIAVYLKENKLEFDL